MAGRRNRNPDLSRLTRGAGGRTASIISGERPADLPDVPPGRIGGLVQPVQKCHEVRQLSQVHVGIEFAVHRRLGIERRGKPFLFATGYGPELLPSLLRRRPILRKPIALDQLKAMIDTMFPDTAAKAPL